MILVQILGGLGNQMFQFAAAYALALRCGVPCKVDLRDFGPNNPRRYELDRFVGAPQAATPDELPQPPGRWRSRAIRLAARCGLPSLLRERGRFVESPISSYDDRFAALKDPVYLSGYYQSERYFQEAADEIRHIYTFRETPSGKNAALIARIVAGNSVSVHVRRGDYVSDPKTNRYHGTCEADYYARAVGLIASKVREPEFFVFSDDPDWAEANLTFPGPSTFVAHNTGDAASEDMRLMSICGHHVIANSSFSWWGAWLNPSAGKIVVAPQRWFRGGAHDTRDLIPSSWVRL